MGIDTEDFGPSDEDRLIASLGISRGEAQKMRDHSNAAFFNVSDQLAESQRFERALRDPEPRVWRGSPNWDI